MENDDRAESYDLSVSRPNSKFSEYRIFQFESILCCGEVVRNLCVNCRIDPDTHDGKTRNVSVFLNGVPWDYNAYSSLASSGIKTGDKLILIELIAN
jgi:hypothetical protein